MIQTHLGKRGGRHLSQMMMRKSRVFQSRAVVRLLMLPVRFCVLAVYARGTACALSISKKQERVPGFWIGMAPDEVIEVDHETN
ncbi:MAG: hypothetical protein N3G20_05205 [Verrucomicrobiae bacterium]|nr:hypothetical protein [Verrucomicrobiae bacterium]